MTARQVFEGMLTELSKVNAPSLLLHEFNYYFNKAINQYINKRYNIYDVNLQTTDDLRVLKATAILEPKKSETYPEVGGKFSKLFGATYEVILPDDYLHMLNCICIYYMNKSYKCYDKEEYVDFAAKRLTADAWSEIVNDYYNRPLPERPYYYIHNVNKNETVPTNPFDDNNSVGTDLAQEYNVPINSDEYEQYVTSFSVVAIDNTSSSGSSDTVSWRVEERKTLLDIEKYIRDKYHDASLAHYSFDNVVETLETDEMYKQRVHSNFPRMIKLGIPDGRTISMIEKDTAQRYGNSSKVRCEIRYGRDDSVFRLDKVFIDYIKAPQTIRLTKEQVDLTEDTSQIMEFPDYVCQEIINELVLLVMSRDADPRLQVQAQVTQSIANPAQQLAPQPQPQQRGS